MSVSLAPSYFPTHRGWPVGDLPNLTKTGKALGPSPTATSVGQRRLIPSSSLSLSPSLSSYFFPHCYEIKRFVRRRRRLRRRVTIREYLAPCQPAPIQSILASNNSTAHPRLLHFHFFFPSFFLSLWTEIVPLCFEENRRFQKGIKIGHRLIFCRDSTKFESELINSEFRISGNFSVYDSSSLDLDHSVLDCSDRNKAQAKNTRRSSSISSFHP